MNPILYQNNNFEQIYEFLTSNLYNVIMVQSAKQVENSHKCRWLMICCHEKLTKNSNNIPYRFMIPIHNVENISICENPLEYVYENDEFELEPGCDLISFANDDDVDIFSMLIKAKENFSAFSIDSITSKTPWLYINLFFQKYKNSILTCYSTNDPDCKWILDINNVERDDDNNLRIHYDYMIPVLYDSCGRKNDYIILQDWQILQPSTENEILIYNMFIKKCKYDFQTKTTPNLRLIKKYGLNSELELKAHIINQIMNSINIEKTLTDILSE